MLSNRVLSRWLARGSLTIAICGFAALMVPPLNAASLRKAAAAAASNAGASDPGSVLYGYFDVSEPTTDNGTGNGINVMRLVNTTGQDMCALIYVFDDDEQLGECCGCPLTANESQSFGIAGGLTPPDGLTDDLTDDWREASADQESGVIAVLGATALTGCTLNGSASNNSTPNPACNAGCDPSISFQDGVLVPGTPSGQGLNGNIVGSQRIGSKESVTEVNMVDDSPGDSDNVKNVQKQCQNNVQNGSGKGICTCGDLYIVAPNNPPGFIKEKRLRLFQGRIIPANFFDVTVNNTATIPFRIENRSKKNTDHIDVSTVQPHPDPFFLIPSPESTNLLPKGSQAFDMEFQPHATGPADPAFFKITGFNIPGAGPIGNVTVEMNGKGVP